MGKNKIFISYRQSDTQSEASRLKENLEDVFGKENVFFDIETLEPGLNFAKAIEKTIWQSAVVLVLIGETWTDVKDEEGNLRLFKEDDWVRKEVAMALAMEDTRVIPVLVKDAKKLSAAQLPDNIKALADYQWAELTIPRWRGDVEKLVSSLEKIIPRPKKEEEKKKFVPLPPKPKSWWAKNYLWVLGIFVVIIILASLPYDDKTDDPPIGPGNEIVKDDDLSQEELDRLKNENPAGNEIYNSLKLEDNPSKNSNTSKAIFVSGNWVLYLEGEQGSVLVMNQGPEEIAFQEYNAFNVAVGSGLGILEGNEMEFDYYNSVVNINGQIYLSTQNNGQTWEGTISFPSNGVSNRIALQRN